MILLVKFKSDSRFGFQFIAVMTKVIRRTTRLQLFQFCTAIRAKAHFLKVFVALRAVILTIPHQWLLAGRTRVIHRVSLMHAICHLIIQNKRIHHLDLYHSIFNLIGLPQAMLLSLL